MLIRVPTTIKIGTHTYKVTYKEHLSKDEGNRGSLCHRLEQMWIEPTNPSAREMPHSYTKFST